MANARFPVIINGIKFDVNPSSIEYSRELKYNSWDTQGGTKYFFWYLKPEKLTIRGNAVFRSAYNQLLFLKRHFEGFDRPSVLYYKTKKYKGFITNLSVSISIENPYLFPYNLTFQFFQGNESDRFDVQDFALLPETAGPIGKLMNIAVDNIISGATIPLTFAENNVEAFLGKIGFGSQPLLPSPNLPIGLRR